MSPVTISTRAKELLEDLPPFLAAAYDAQAVVDALSLEVERLEAAVANVRANYYPQTGQDFLGLWESLLGLPVKPPDKTVAQRRTSILSYLQGLKGHGTGLDWEAQMNSLIGTSWTYEEHDPAVPTSPAAHTLRIKLPFTAPLAAPAVPTMSSLAGGSTLGAGTYHYVVTATNAYGETLPSPSASVAIAASARPVLDWPDVVGATGYRVYRGTSAVNHTRIATIATATSAYTDTGTASTGEVPPTSNSTGSTQAYDAEQFARKVTPAHLDLIFGYGIGFIVGISRVGEEPL